MRSPAWGEAAAALIAEIGLDMTRFASPDALVSWAGLTPTARQSGPRKGRGKKGHGNTYAKRIAVLAAYAAANTDTFLGERFRRLASRPGGGRKKAGCAVGRSILVIVWHLLNDPAARYRDLGSDWHARHTDRTARPATPSASSRPSATTSSSPSARTPPELAAPLTAYRRRQAPGPRPATGPSRHLPEKWSRQTAEVVISWSDRRHRAAHLRQCSEFPIFTTYSPGDPRAKMPSRSRATYRPAPATDGRAGAAHVRSRRPRPGARPSDDIIGVHTGACLRQPGVSPRGRTLAGLNRAATRRRSLPGALTVRFWRHDDQATACATGHQTATPTCAWTTGPLARTVSTLTVVRGTNSKPTASSTLEQAFGRIPGLDGQLFIGYPIIAFPERGASR